MALARCHVFGPDVSAAGVGCDGASESAWPVNGPGPGAVFKTTYRQALSADSPVFAVVSGFIHTYLTATTGLDRYVLANTVLGPVGGTTVRWSPRPRSC
jgi:hypothetical protein